MRYQLLAVSCASYDTSEKVYRIRESQGLSFLKDFGMDHKGPNMEGLNGMRLRFLLNQRTNAHLLRLHVVIHGVAVCVSLRSGGHRNNQEMLVELYVAPCGEYVAGKEKGLEAAATCLSAPQLGADFGSTPVM